MDFLPKHNKLYYIADLSSFASHCLCVYGTRCVSFAEQHESHTERGYFQGKT
jgi:hypothetical protein